MSDAADAPRVLVTGASGFIASHIIAALLTLGYRVRGTVRSVAKAPRFLADLAPQSRYKLELVEADLLQSECWITAVSGCAYVLHVASPFTFNVADAEASLTRPAVEGTLNVLRAVAACPAPLRPRRVVLTSSLSSVAYGRPLPPGHVFTEADWSDPDSTAFGMGAYQRSKTLAERAAWDFVRGLPPDDAFELCAVCPGSVFGPLLGKQANTGAEWVWKPLIGAPPLTFAPPIELPLVDIRDVVRVHVLAMTAPGAPGHRFPLSTMSRPFADVFRVLADEFNPQGFSVSRVVLPRWALWAAAAFDRDAAAGYRNSSVAAPTCSHAEVRDILGVAPASLHTDFGALVREVAYSCVRHGVVAVPKGAPPGLAARPPAWAPESAVDGLPRLPVGPGPGGVSAGGAAALAGEAPVEGVPVPPPERTAETAEGSEA